MKSLRPALLGLTRTIGRRLLFPAFQAIWSALFSVAGFILRPRLRLLKPTGADRVLVLAPHPDDETIGCGGTIALHAQRGDHVAVCIVTDGGESRAAGLAQGEMRRRRRSEATSSIASLGEIELIQLGLPEGSWQANQLVPQLIQLIERLKPSVIYSAPGIDYHAEHIRVCHSLRQALEKDHTQNLPTIRLYEVQVPLTPLLANCASQISEVHSRKVNALRAYNTQLASLSWTHRYEEYQRRLYNSDGPLELFVELSVAEFIAFDRMTALHPGHFRGIRLRPFTDPLSWTTGIRVRHRLAKSSGSRRDSVAK